MKVDILDGSCTLEIGNPGKVLSQIARGAVEGELSNPTLQMLAGWFGSFIAGVDGVTVNDANDPDAVDIRNLWLEADISDDYAALFRRYCDLDTRAVNALYEACNNAVNARYAAPPELRVASEEDLPDPEAASADGKSSKKKTVA